MQINSEYSAQRRSHPPNPALIRSIHYLKEHLNQNVQITRIADLGCGKLRHLKLLLPYADNLFLVDTQLQLNSQHVDGSDLYTIEEVARASSKNGKSVHALSIDKMENMQLKLDLIFCVAVFDVVTQKVRDKLLQIASKNLKENGYLVLIIPRNDSSILKRCTEEKRYQDGYIFTRYKIRTFFHNFKSYKKVIHHCLQKGLHLAVDLSLYRQVCLIFKKTYK
ncbi:MAG: class I SAM-dependent methyltransferase [Chrysiogenia bacterium]